MKNRETTVRSSLSFPAIMAGLLVFSGVLFFTNKHTREYSTGKVVQAETEKDAGAGGMMEYFFNARKNPATNSMDYAAMLATDKQIAKMNSSRKSLGASLGFNWRGLGPSNIGGRTRAILIDKKDATGQTVFAGGVSGGIWKSTNGGSTWDSINDNLSNICVSCIAQDANGNIFIGTGEGFSQYYQGEAFSTGILGGGIFESTDDGATFNQLPATAPAAVNNESIAWAYTNRIAINPTNPSVIYAATNAGLMVSTDGGTTFNYATQNTTQKLTGNSLDVKISNDGQIVVACYNGNGYYAYPSVSNTNFTLIHSSGYGALAESGLGRIEFGIAPSNSNYIYASVVGPNDNFIGIYYTQTAVSKNNGGNWIEIGPGGSKAFDPYDFDGDQGQGTYDNAIGVSPANPGLAFFGGTTLWSWEQTNAADSSGNWTSVTQYFGYVGDALYVHPDMHTIVFNPNNANTMYIGCDGGVYKSTDGSKSWQVQNRNYNVTQFYAIACSPFVNKNGEGVIGGTQDNGTPYISGTQFYYEDAVDLGGGDGGCSAISSINPNAYYVTSDGDALLRSVNLSGYGSPGNAYSSNEGLNKGANIDSIYALGTGCFVPQIALFENPYDTTTLDTLLWVADKAYTAGDTIYPVSPNGNVSFPYIIHKSVVAGDSLRVQNRVVSKIATAFSASNGVWMMMQAIDFQDPEVWMPIGGPLSKPDAFTGAGDPVHCLAWSPDGDALFVATEEGQFFRFSNLDSIVDTSYVTGGLFSIPDAAKSVTNPLTRVISKSLTSAVGVAGADILSIAVDPKNGNNVIVTTGSYTNKAHVFFSSNALSAAPTFASAQGSLPYMPVYGSVMDIVNSPYPHGAIVATEHGVYTTTDITVSSPVWTLDNAGMANTIVCAIKQQTLAPWNCNNSGDVYIGTHGRGAWVDTTFFIPTGIAPVVASSTKINLNIYPNPMNVSGTLTFTLPASDKVIVTIYDVQGKVVQVIPVSSQAPGFHSVNINSQNMMAGVYLATVTGTNFRQTIRFVVAR